MDYIQALKILDNQTMSGLYVLSGEEVFLIDKFVDLFKEKIISKEFFDMNYTQIDFSKVDITKLKLDCEMAPFFSKKRLILVKDVNLSKNGVSIFKTFFDQMYQYLEKIPNTTVLVFVMKGELAFKGKFYKKISSIGHNIELIKLSYIDTFKFIKKRFNIKNVQIKDSTIKYIIDRIGYLDSSRNKNLYDVENEVKKIIDSYNGKIIEIEDVDKILVDKFENSIFKLLDYISLKDYKNSITTLLELKKSKEDMFSIFYMIVRYVRNLLAVKALKLKQKKVEQIAKELKISNYECKKLYNVEQTFKIQTLCNYIQLCYEVEENIKTKQRNIEFELELLISKMIIA